DSADRTRHSLGADLQGCGAVPRRRPGTSDAADRRACAGPGVTADVDAVNTLPPSIAQALTDPLADARARATRGERIVGMVGKDVPVELVWAAGAQPCALPSFADRPTPQADAVLEPGFVPAVRSIVEQWLTGELEFMSAVVFSR